MEDLELPHDLGLRTSGGAFASLVTRGGVLRDDSLDPLVELWTVSKCWNPLDPEACTYRSVLAVLVEGLVGTERPDSDQDRLSDPVVLAQLDDPVPGVGELVQRAERLKMRVAFWSEADVNVRLLGGREEGRRWDADHVLAVLRLLSASSDLWQSVRIRWTHPQRAGRVLRRRPAQLVDGDQVIEVEAEAWVVRVDWVLRYEAVEWLGELYDAGADGHVGEREC